MSGGRIKYENLICSKRSSYDFFVEASRSVVKTKVTMISNVPKRALGVQIVQGFLFFLQIALLVSFLPPPPELPFLNGRYRNSLDRALTYVIVNSQSARPAQKLPGSRGGICARSILHISLVLFCSVGRGVNARFDLRVLCPSTLGII